MIKFNKLRVPTILISIVLILFGVFLLTGLKINLGPLTPKGLNLGIDFQGGLVQQITVYSGIEQEEVRQLAVDAGLGSDIQKIIVPERRQIGKQASYLIKTIITDEEQKEIKDKGLTPAKFLSDRADKFAVAIKQKHGETYELTGEELKRANEVTTSELTGENLALKTDSKRVLSNVVTDSTNVISPVYSQDLAKQSAFLILFVLLALLLYITIRFKFKFAIGAIAALLHDGLIIFGFLALAQIEFDFTIVAATLTIFGYSLNDTIVIFDRIRENYTIMGEEYTAKEIINTSINQSLTRTIITSVTTLLAVLALYFWAGPRINGFAVVLIVGIFSGTYSSIFIASPIVDSWDKLFADKKTKLKEQKKEEKMLQREQAAESGEEAVTENASSSDNIQLSKKQLKKLQNK